MQTTRLSSKGQVIIPKPLRMQHNWAPGQELVAIDSGDGILLKPVSPFPETSLKTVSSCLSFSGRAKSIEEMDAAIKKGAKDGRR